MNSPMIAQHLVNCWTFWFYFFQAPVYRWCTCQKFRNHCTFHNFQILNSAFFPVLNHVPSVLVSTSHCSKSLSLLILPPSSASHRCIGVSCCGCSRCRLAGRLWSSALWRRVGSRCCRSRSPVCRRSNQQRAHLRLLARWAHRMTQL